MAKAAKTKAAPAKTAAKGAAAKEKAVALAAAKAAAPQGQVFVRVTNKATASKKPDSGAYYAEGGLIIPRSSVIAILGTTIFYETLELVGNVEGMDFNEERGVSIYKTNAGPLIALRPEFVSASVAGGVAPALSSMVILSPVLKTAIYCGR